MALGLIGIKRGMTRVYEEDGQAVPVTVIEVDPNRVTCVKSPAADGYSAVQVTAGSKHRNRINKPDAGVFAKASIAAGRGLWEFRLAEGEGAELAPGAELKVDVFAQGQYVDVTGTTIGKGFAGTTLCPTARCAAVVSATAWGRRQSTPHPPKAILLPPGGRGRRRPKCLRRRNPSGERMPWPPRTHRRAGRRWRAGRR